MIFLKKIILPCGNFSGLFLCFVIFLTVHNNGNIKPQLPSLLAGNQNPFFFFSFPLGCTPWNWGSSKDCTLLCDVTSSSVAIAFNSCPNSSFFQTFSSKAGWWGNRYRSRQCILRKNHLLLLSRLEPGKKLHTNSMWLFSGFVQNAGEGPLKKYNQG